MDHSESLGSWGPSERAGQAPSRSPGRSCRVGRFLLWQPPTPWTVILTPLFLLSGSHRPGPGCGLETEQACALGRGKVPMGPGWIFEVGREGAQHLFQDTPVRAYDSARRGPRGDLPPLSAQAQSWQGTASPAGGAATAKAWEWEQRSGPWGTELECGIPGDGGAGTETVLGAEVPISPLPGTYVWPWPDRSASLNPHFLTVAL